jgi:ABC-type enterochelin transport system substrate-binding protein
LGEELQCSVNRLSQTSPTVVLAADDQRIGQSLDQTAEIGTCSFQHGASAAALACEIEKRIDFVGLRTRRRSNSDREE